MPDPVLFRSVLRRLSSRISRERGAASRQVAEELAEACGIRVWAVEPGGWCGELAGLEGEGPGQSTHRGLVSFDAAVLVVAEWLYEQPDETLLRVIRQSNLAVPA
jgi:hypothetical protein